MYPKRAKFSSTIVFFCCALFFVSYIFIDILRIKSIYASENIIDLPTPGTMLNSGKSFDSVLMKGVKIYPDNPLKFDFIIDTADSKLKGEALKNEINKLVKYFLASLTVSENDVWVNLSPYEEDRIIPEKLAATAMGRDLLAQDYILKQLTSSLLHPDKEIGKEFWRRSYEKADALYGNSNVAIDTFNKIWIMPDKAVVHQDGTKAFVGEKHLKVMLEDDHMSVNAKSTGIIRELILPEIEREVNDGEHFARLRQIYNSMILASWFKRHLKKNILSKVYVGKNKTSGVAIKDKKMKEKIYAQYLEAFKVGVFDLTKKEKDSASKQLIKRRYFSGGFDENDLTNNILEIIQGPVSISSWKTNGAFILAKSVFEPVKANASSMIERRKLLQMALGVGAAALVPSSVYKELIDFPQKRDSTTTESREINVDNYDPGVFEISFKYLNKLSKKDAEAYFDKLDKFIRVSSKNRAMVEPLLWQVFNESECLWMVSRAITLLIRHKFIDFNAAKKIVDRCPDLSVVSDIYNAIAEDPTEEIIFYLKDRIQIEHKHYITNESLNKALENSKTIPSKIAKEILIASKEKNFFAYRYAQYSIYDSETFAILARTNTLAHRMLMGYAKNIKEPHMRYSLPYALAKAETPESEDLLLQLSRSEAKSSDGVWYMRKGLLALKTPVVEKRIFELSYSLDKNPKMFHSVVAALEGLNSEAAAKRLVELSREFEGDDEKCANFGYGGGKVHFPEMEKRILELSHDKRGRVRKIMAYALADLGTEKSKKRLLDWSRDKNETKVVNHFVIQGLGSLGTHEGKVRLKELYYEALRNRDHDLISYTILESFKDQAPKDVVEWMLKEVETLKEDKLVEDMAEAIYKISGFKAFELLQRRFESASGETAENLRVAIESLVRSIDREFWRNFNHGFEINPRYAEEEVELFVNRLREYPQAMFCILALSQELTSHTFPVVYESFKNYLTKKYTNVDFISYIKEQFDDNFITNYLFTLTIFAELENSFSLTEHRPKELVDMIFSEKSIKMFFDKPALFAKIAVMASSFKTASFKDAFVAKIVGLSKKKEEFGLLLKLLVEYDFIQNPHKEIVDFIAGIKLPFYEPVWKGPQSDWLNEDGVLEVGLYWSIAAKSEGAHFQQFQRIFRNGKQVNSFYANFAGYRDLSSQPDYKKKCAEKEAEGVLVKTFPRTGRKVEIYLYSTLDNIKDSKYPITITRGHAGDPGNRDYPGMPGGLRIVSHCRSINDTDSLIKANGQSATITVTGTARARETNPVIYYMLEYLGNNRSWGDWNKIKGVVGKRMPKSIKKYNFPADDVSNVYAILLQIIRKSEALGSSSSSIELLKTGVITKNIGGIGLNSQMLDLQTKGSIENYDSPFNLKELATETFQGFNPIIYELLPATETTN